VALRKLSDSILASPKYTDASLSLCPALKCASLAHNFTPRIWIPSPNVNTVGCAPVAGNEPGAVSRRTVRTVVCCVKSLSCGKTAPTGLVSPGGGVLTNSQSRAPERS